MATKQIHPYGIILLHSQHITRAIGSPNLIIMNFCGNNMESSYEINTPNLSAHQRAVGSANLVTVDFCANNIESSARV